MWSSSARALTFGAVLAVTSVLSACSGFTPVYSSGEAPALRFGAPTTRIDQVIYNDLGLRFAPPTGSAPKLTVMATQSSRDLTSDSVKQAFSQRQTTVTAKFTLVDGAGRTLLAQTRSASADYETGPQVVANQQAQADAAERAAHLLADTIRLSVLGALGK